MIAQWLKSEAISLAGFRRVLAKILLAVAILQVPVLIVVALLRQANVPLTALLAGLLASVPAVLFRLGGRPVAVAHGLAAALVGQIALLVILMRGHPWQVEAHFCFFVVLAMAAGFCARRVIVSAAALIVISQVSISLLYPGALYSADGVARALMHGCIVAVEAAVFVVIAGVIRSAFEELEKLRAAAEHAASELAGAAGARETALQETSARADGLRGLLESFEADVSASIDTLHANATGLMGNAERLAISAAKHNAQIVTVSVSSEETARKVELVATAGEALSRAIGEVGASAARSSLLAAAAVEAAETTGVTMDELASVSAEIGAVTGLINGIAAQTNLLALNATIEAARAGEAGRGFSVVAQEVKALANATAKATQDIAARVAAMQQSSGRSVDAIQKVSGKIRELQESAATIAAAVDEQTIAAQGIAANVASAAKGVAHVEKSIVAMEGVAESSAMALQEVSLTAQDVARGTSTIQARIHVFTADIARARAS